MPLFQTSPGTRDILPPEGDRWRRFVEVFGEVAGSANYGHLVSPIFEEIGVYQRVGEATDVVSKEMYDFADKSGRHLVLRPELTAGVCRAFAQHRPATPWKVWYAGPMFRYERPQAGRYRQFDQVGIEVLGSEDPDLDSEVIALGWDFLRRLGLTEISLLVNSLGDADDRLRYSEALRGYLQSRSDRLSEQSVATLERNPLRVLDSKRPEDADVLTEAPVVEDFLGQESKAHFARVLDGLDDYGITYHRSPRLVRGLDYYRRTTFEFVSTRLDGAQNAVGGGGRYDGLVADLGGPDTVGIGFAIGLDRTLLACDAEGVFDEPVGSASVFVVDTDGGRHARRLVHELRRRGVSAERSYDDRSMKSQMKQADRTNALLAAIVGPDEASRGEWLIRDLATGNQESCPEESILQRLTLLVERSADEARAGHPDGSKQRQ